METFRTKVLNKPEPICRFQHWNLYITIVTCQIQCNICATDISYSRKVAILEFQNLPEPVCKLPWQPQAEAQTLVVLCVYFKWTPLSCHSLWCWMCLLFLERVKEVMITLNHSFWLLAPTGALIVTVVYYSIQVRAAAAATF